MTRMGAPMTQRPSRCSSVIKADSVNVTVKFDDYNCVQVYRVGDPKLVLVGVVTLSGGDYS